MIINRSFSSSLSNKERFGSLKSLVLLVVIAILATSNSYAQASLICRKDVPCKFYYRFACLFCFILFTFASCNKTFINTNFFTI